MVGTMRGRFAHKALAVLASAVMVSSMNGVLPVYAEEIGEVFKAASVKLENESWGTVISDDLRAEMNGTTLTISGTGVLDSNALKIIRSNFGQTAEYVKFEGHVYAPKNYVGLFGDGYIFTTLKGVDLTNFDTSKVTNMTYWFASRKDTAGKFTKTIVFPSDFDTSNVESMYGMFRYGANIKELDLTNLRITGKVTNIANMFEGCSNLESIVFNDVDTSNVYNMADLFNGCSSLKKLDLRKFKTSKVNNMSGMFKDCESLKKVDLSSFDTSKTFYYNYMFEDCSSLEQLDIGNFDMSNVIDADDMFKGCSFKKLVTPKAIDTEVDIDLPEEMVDNNGKVYKKLPESSVTVTKVGEDEPGRRGSPSENKPPVSDDDGKDQNESTKKASNYIVGAGKIDMKKYLGITESKGIRYKTSDKHLAKVNHKGVAILKGKSGDVTITALNKKTKAVIASYTLHLIVPDIKEKVIEVKQSEVKSFKVCDCISCNEIKPVLASSKSNVVNVDNETGEVKIAGKGSAMIYAVYNGNSVKDKFGSKRKYKVKVKVV